MKVCSLYGAGFYYMPGTDMCIKIGGWVRAEATWGINGSSTTGIFGNGGDYNNRYTNNLWTRERGYITADAREQTEYGVARGYIAVGIASNNEGNEVPSAQANMNRAFVQWAGFTAGLAASFYDFYPAAALLYRAGNIPNEDTGDGGQWVWAYTAQLGGGFSATLSAEERRNTQIIDMGGTAASLALPSAAGACSAPAALNGAAIGGLAAGSVCVTPAAAGAVGGMSTPGTNGSLLAGGSTLGYGGWQVFDIVGNLRVDQAWGGAQLSGALHEDNSGYYGTTPATGHPGDQWGWVASVGLKINAPFIAQGDYFITQAAITEGALRYLWDANPDSNVVVSGSSQGFGVTTDCVYGGTLGAANNTSCHLTSAVGLDIAYEHYWTPQWHQSLVFNGEWVRYDAAANNMQCVAEGAGTGAGTSAAATAGCDNNWALWGVGSRLQWDVTKSFYVGVEALYQYIDSASLPGGVLPKAMALTNSGATTVANESNWTFTIRMHKDFLP